MSAENPTRIVTAKLEDGKALRLATTAKPDAGKPHVRFDERGGETGRARDTALFLDSTGGI
jgi:hypothetical protein